ncbi:hypothetical protein HNQ41_000097 [Texcoconibacillus texcoconensis]|uniref:Uncharacterized protein n=1 Tax=Texcoconibacillus texcoconensis TaxID=1095777 RepID=A0A840QKM7_9BACI|nr:hypothetical protein [Texcoconibacillus texcoconensis]
MAPLLMLDGLCQFKYPFFYIDTLKYSGFVSIPHTIIGWNEKP